MDKAKWDAAFNKLREDLKRSWEEKQAQIQSLRKDNDILVDILAEKMQEEEEYAKSNLSSLEKKLEAK